jgi:ribulose-phosphate 3-epimerase
MARRTVGMPLSVHLMMTNPGNYLEPFIRAGADILLIHIEIEGDVRGMLRRIRELGARPGITLNPATPAERVFECMPEVDEILCMTVNPGYGGQSFMADVLPKMDLLRRRLQQVGHPAAVSVDGGIDLNTAPQAAAAGANAFIAGTSLYRLPDMADGVTKLRQAARQSFAARQN